MIIDDVGAHISAGQEQFMERLFQFLRFRSVSTDPAYEPEMRKTRDFLKGWLAEIGLDNIQELDGGGKPAIYAECLNAPEKPTLLIYGHYDVQPPEPLELWKTDPFEPTIVGDRLYARGASDVKGSTAIAIETIGAFIAVTGHCPVNVKLFLEGEEETGSPSLDVIVDQFGDLLSADAIISADGGRASPDVPSINVGARGLAKTQLTVRTAAKEVHSGRYGGSIRNALHETAALVASLHDANGAVAVESIRDLTRPMTKEQRANAAALPFDEEAFIADVGALGAGEPGHTIRERLTLLPAIDVNGMWGGYTGVGSKTVIPEVAHAKITIRLSPGIDSDAALAVLKEHLRGHASPGVELEFTATGGGAPASEIRADHPLVLAAQSVLKADTGLDPVHVRLGSTVPITSIFRERLGIETLMFGMNLPDEDIHAPNEFLHLKSIPLGLRIWPALLNEIASFAPADFANKREGNMSN